MNRYLTFLFMCCWLTGFAQPDMHPDTTTDYHKRFYDNGRLKTTNTMVFTDSVGHRYTQATLDQLLEKHHMDTTGFQTEKEGLWANFYDKKWNPADSSAYEYYSLTQYRRGFATGKIYYFHKQQLNHMILRYPPYHDSVFNGYRTTRFREDGSVSSVEYERFIEDSVKGFYDNTTWYYPNGQVRVYSLLDDFHDENRYLQYNKKGLCTSESHYSKTQGHWIKRKRHGKIELVTRHSGGKRTRSKYKNGKLVKEKEL